MKAKYLTIITVSALLPLIGFAQPPTPPNPPNPPNPPAPGMPPGAPEDRHDHRGGPKVPVTWLGVDTSPIPPVLCEQMNLPKGFGLVVDYVVPDGPAASAGLQQNDILKMLNDQILMEPEQLSKLIRSYSEGTTVTLTVLRKGKEEKLTVKLGKKEVPQRRGMDFQHGFGELNDKFRELQEQFGDQNQGMIHDAVMTAQAEAQRVREEAERRRDEAQRVREEAQRVREQAQRAGERAREEAQRIAEQVREQARSHNGGNIRVTRTSANGLQTTKIDVGKAQIVFSDDKGELRIENVDGKKVLTAKDPQGRLLFSGPVETKEELDKVPADVRQRYENLQQKDLPSVISSQDEDDNAHETDEDNDEDDDDDSSALEQASCCPQTFSHQIWAYQMVLI